MTKKIMIVGLVLLIWIGGIVYYEYQDQKKENAKQELLLKKVSRLGSQKIVSLEVALGHIRKGKAKTFDSVDIEIVQTFLTHTDTGRVAGHSHPIYECMLTFTLEGGGTVSFLGSVYDNSENDLFLADSFYRQLENGSFVEVGYTKPVRVRDLGKWLRENGPKKQEHN
jgi:hypothetical protein